MRFFYSSDGIKTHKRRVEPLDVNEGTPSNLIEQYVGLKPEWMRHPRRHCRGVDTNKFFGDSDAASICDKCPVLQPCQEYGLENHPIHGIWGGLTEADRTYIRKAAKR